jgi:hypothetical protein
MSPIKGYKMNLLKVLSTAVLLSMSFAANSAAMTYVLGDHLDGELYKLDNSNPYGLRYDSAVPVGKGPTFSIGTNLGGLGGTTTVAFDAGDLAAGAILSGTLERNDDGTFWTVNYTMTDLVAAVNGGFKAEDGSGSVNEIGGALRSFALDGKQDDSGYAFIFDNDGHRLASSDGWVGRGWLEPSTVSGTDDFLLTATVVPVPAAAWLFMSALGLLGAATRRRVSK